MPLVVNQRIVTRGLGTRQLLATRGYGRVIRVVEVGKRRPRGGRPKEMKRVAVEEKKCFEINVALMAINGEPLDLVLKGKDYRCFDDDDDRVIKAKLDAVNNPPDPTVVEAVLKAVRSRKKRG